MKKHNSHILTQIGIFERDRWQASNAFLPKSFLFSSSPEIYNYMIFTGPRSSFIA